jgi:hypothetical protein
MKFETKNYPVVFLSYNEPNCEENYQKLLEIVPNALRVHGIKGSDTAHKQVANMVLENNPSATNVIIVDGDNEIVNNFLALNYNLNDDVNLSTSVLSFSALNNVNGNCYGNGGIKVWPVELLKTMRTHENSTNPNSIDFNLDSYLELNYPASTTVVNSSPLQAWHAGFREGFKLAYGVSYKDINWRNYDRLWRWMHIGQDVANGIWAIYGARVGCHLALTGYDPSRIRDFEFIEALFRDNYDTYKDNMVNECNRIGNLIRVLTNDQRIKNVYSIRESQEFRVVVKPILRSPESFIKYKYNPPYDIVFISYNEPNADRNYQLLTKMAPKAKRINGVKGIHNAHIEAAKLCESDYFWVVDGDAVIVDNFVFEHNIGFYEPEKVRVWRSKNSVNDLIYGNGGVKLLPRMATIRMQTNRPDMTTSICNLYEPIIKLSNITEFNTDPFSTWRSAFRECVKLASQVIDRQVDIDTQKRLDAWCNLGSDRLYGKYAIEGAKAGREYGSTNKGNYDALKLINDFDWLRTQYDKFYRNTL